jgi:murein DD-endopeptidase MepM/ murein hydrolase activator NlpD
MLGLVLAGFATGGAGVSLASSVDGPSGDPAGRGLQLLRDRETILATQANAATQAARARGRMLYRLLLHAAAERTGGQNSSQTSGRPSGSDPGGRAISLAIAVLDRDLREADVLRGELARVRAEREATDDASGGARADASRPAVTRTTPKMLAPVAGAPVIPFGVARDDSTGAWLFHSSASYATKAGTPVLAPADGRVERVTDEEDGRAVVLSHAGGWTTVLGGLAGASVAAHDVVRRGHVIGTTGTRSSALLRVEVWRAREPIDPVSVLRTR